MHSESGKKTDCIACGKKEILPGNFIVFGLIENYSGILFAETGASPEGIKLAFEAESIPQEMRKELIYKIILFVSTAIMTRRSKT